MRKLFVFLGVVFMTIGSAVSAQEVDSIAPLQKSSWGDAKKSEIVDYIPDISLDMKGGYSHEFTEGVGAFFGEGLYLDINGYISPNFSYSLNQRIAAPFYEDNSGFNGTNWLTLTYEVGNFAFTAGKDAIFVGSFEYDAYDLDSYYDMNSMFYNMFDCWQWGVSAAWYPTDLQSLSLQIANSPFAYGEPNLYAYALAWRGEWDWYESYWTANLWQYDAKQYAPALNFGNRFYFGDFTIDLEYMTRAGGVGQLFKTKDFTTLLAPSYEPGESLRIFGKFGWEHSEEEAPYELAYEEWLGRSRLVYGAGIEYFPLKEDKDIRLHATWSTSCSGFHTVNIGLTWKLDLTTAGKHLLRSLSR